MPPKNPKKDKQNVGSKEYSCVRGLKIKEESDTEDLVVTGLIATTHPDRMGDILSVNALKQMVELINDTTTVGNNTTHGSVRSVSLYHDWVKEENPELDEAAFLKPTARLVTLENNNHGIEVDAVINKYYKGDMTTEEIKYRVDNGGIGGFSIEYNTDDAHCKQIDYDGSTYNYIEGLTDFGGVGFARSRLIANPSAVIYKEIEILANKIKEDNKMSKETKVKEDKVKEPLEEVKTVEEEAKPEPVVEAEPVVETEAKVEPEPEVKEKVKEKVEVPKITKEMVMDIIRETKEWKTAIEDIKVKDKVIKTKEENKMELRVKELNDSLKDVKEYGKFKELAQEENLYDLAVKEAIMNPMLTMPKRLGSGLDSNQAHRGLNVKCVGKGLKIVGELKLKGTLDATKNTSSYTQSPVEFDDVFAAGIIDTFNNQVNYFGFLRKEAHPGGTHYQWRMITDQDPDTNLTFVDFNDTSVAKNYASKLKYQTPIKIARRGVEVADTTQMYSSRSLGDEFMLELDIQMNFMMTQVDKAILAEVADGTGNAPLGTLAIADSAGNTTIYGLTRSTTNRLSPDTVTATYYAVVGALTEAAIRGGCDYLEIAGSRKEDIAIIAHPTTRTYLFNLLDGQRQFITTDAKFGFNKKQTPTYDGYPIIVDHNLASDSILIIDQSADVIVVAMEPRVVNLAKVGASISGYLEFHFAHVYKEPRKSYWLDGIAS